MLTLQHQAIIFENISFTGIHYYPVCIIAASIKHLMSVYLSHLLSNINAVTTLLWHMLQVTHQGAALAADTASMHLGPSV